MGLGADGVAIGQKMLENARAKKERKRRKKLSQKKDTKADMLVKKSFIDPQDIYRPEDFIYPYIDDDDTDEDIG